MCVWVFDDVDVSEKLETDRVKYNGQSYKNEIHYMLYNDFRLSNQYDFTNQCPLRFGNVLKEEKLTYSINIIVMLKPNHTWDAQHLLNL